MLNKEKEALGQHYHAFYRSLAIDCYLISKFFSKHSLLDIDPSHLNPWKNTLFYSFIMEK